MEKNKSNIRKGIILGFIISAAVLIGILSSYAYFTMVGNNSSQTSAQIQTGNMILVFADGNNGINQALNFGESVTKTFTIENTGSLDAVARIDWENFKNTYLYGSLTYKLEYSSEENGTYTEVINNLEVPRSEVETTLNLVNSLNIPANTKYYYKLTITLNYLETIDQTADLNAILSTKFKLGEGSDKIELVFDTNGVDVEVQNKMLDLNSSYGDLPVLSKPGYLFRGWFTSENVEVTKNNILSQPVNTTIYAKWEESFNIVEAVNAIKNNQTPKGVNTNTPDFSRIATTDEGVFSMADDYGTSYYFRGVVENNYIKFANFYWRVIRVNGDGSVRMIYDGEQAYANRVSDTRRLALTNIAWNTESGDAKYVGYMYGGPSGTASTSKEQAQTNETNSNIKIQLENWYRTNIKNKGFDGFVADNIFCNDRSTADTAKKWWVNESSTPGYGIQRTAYGAFSRFCTILLDWQTPAPKFKCPEKNDAFTKSDISKGNGALSEKVGLITVDEIGGAGFGRYFTSNNYLYKGSSYWSLSPEDFDGVQAVMFNVHEGSHGFASVSDASGVAPVINLSPEYVSQMIGDGTTSNPYRASNITP